MFMVLMDFAVCSKRGATVAFVIKAMAKDYLLWTPSRRDAHGRRKVVEPHNNEVMEMYQHQLGKFWVGKCAYNAT
jgi:hypothetical protein